MALGWALATFQQLLNHYRRLHNGIAHFSVDNDAGSDRKLHAFISDGDLIRAYSVASSAILHYIRLKVEGLRAFVIQPPSKLVPNL